MSKQATQPKTDRSGVVAALRRAAATSHYSADALELTTLAEALAGESSGGTSAAADLAEARKERDEARAERDKAHELADGNKRQLEVALAELTEANARATDLQRQIEAAKKTQARG